MQTDWTKGLSELDGEAIKKKIATSKFLLDRLTKICYNNIQELETPSSKDYDCPSWAFKQAHKNGMIMAYRDIIKLCTLDQRDQNKE